MADSFDLVCVIFTFLINSYIDIRFQGVNKTWYPMSYLTPEKYGKVYKQYPSETDYGIDKMSEPEKIVFRQWLEREKVGNGPSFDSRQRLLEYCIIDCQVLMKAVLLFADLVEEQCGLYL